MLATASGQNLATSRTPRAQVDHPRITQAQSLPHARPHSEGFARPQNHLEGNALAASERLLGIMLRYRGGLNFAGVIG